MAHGTFCYCHGYRSRDPKMTVTARNEGNARLTKLGNSAHTNSRLRPHVPHSSKHTRLLVLNAKIWYSFLCNDSRSDFHKRANGLL